MWTRQPGASGSVIYRMNEVLDLASRHGMVEAARLSYRIREEEIAKAWKWPNRIVTALFGVTYFLVLLVAGRLVRREDLEPRASKIVRDLSARYYYIPEIVIFKALELEAACKRRISGRALDLGCGTGLTGATIRLNTGIDELFGVDRTRTLVAHDQYAGYCLGDGVRLPFRGE